MSILNIKIALSIFSLFILLSCKENGSDKNATSSEFNTQDINCIKRIFSEDSILGKIRNNAPKEMSLSEAINNYTNNTIALDFTNCPEDFKSAFYKHIDAWDTIIVLTNKYPSLRGEMHDAFEELERNKDSTEFKLMEAKIWDTWKLVELSSN